MSDERTNTGDADPTDTADEPPAADVLTDNGMLHHPHTSLRAGDVAIPSSYGAAGGTVGDDEAGDGEQRTP